MNGSKSGCRLLYYKPKEFIPCLHCWLNYVKGLLIHRPFSLNLLSPLLLGKTITELELLTQCIVMISVVSYAVDNQCVHGSWLHFKADR